MGRRGPAPVLGDKAAARGERRPCRTPGEQLVEFPTEMECPEPPADMHEAGQKMWRTVAPHLYAQRVMTHADQFALEHMCRLHGKAMRLYANGGHPSATDLGQLRSYFQEFGMTPAARARLTKPAGEKEKNPFKRNGKRGGEQSDKVQRN